MTSTRWISGSLTFCGRLERTRVTASLTSLSARSVLVSSANWIVVTDRPSVIDDEICRTPSTPDTPSSMVLVTCDSSSAGAAPKDRKSTRLNSSHVRNSYAVFCLKKKKHENNKNKRGKKKKEKKRKTKKRANK